MVCLTEDEVSKPQPPGLTEHLLLGRPVLVSHEEDVFLFTPLTA